MTYHNDIFIGIYAKSGNQPAYVQSKQGLWCSLFVTITIKMFQKIFYLKSA